MDESAVEATKRHYDRHAWHVRTKEESMRMRKQGLAMPLKKFHNQIKRALIQTYAQGKEKLLDLACGRGGDINKWNDAGVKHVTGIDLSPKEIEEAKRRYEDTAKRKDFSGMTCEFRQTDELGRKNVQWEETYDVVTCMFAAHYFHASETAFKCFVENAASALKEGGYFIGTVPDGKRVLRSLGQQPKYTTPMLVLQAMWDGGYRPFGSAYTCSITDTVTEGGQGSYEYLVFFTPFTAICKQYGLHPVANYQNPGLEHMLDPEDKNSAFKHFHPHFPGSPLGLEEASALNCTFVFQKRSGEAHQQGTETAPCNKRKAEDQDGHPKVKERRIEASTVQKSPSNAPECLPASNHSEGGQE